MHASSSLHQEGRESGLSNFSLCPELKNTCRSGFGVCENISILVRDNLIMCTQQMLKAS